MVLMRMQAVRYESALSNMKYCLQQLMHDNLESDCGHKLLSALAVRDIWLCSLCSIFLTVLFNEFHINVMYSFFNFWPSSFLFLI